MIKKSYLFLFAATFILLSTISFAADPFFRIPAVSVPKDTSFLIRTVCSYNSKIVIASNKHGSDIAQIFSNSLNADCENDGVKKILYVNAEYAGDASTGVIRKHCINSIEFQTFTPKNNAPSIIQILKNDGSEKNC